MRNLFAVVVLSVVGFIGMGCFDNVYAYPLLFPFVGGIIVMMINKSNTERRSYGAILQYGFYGALLACIIAIPVIWFLAKDTFTQRIKGMGYAINGDSFLKAIGAAILSLGIIFFISYLVGTAIGALFPERKKVSIES